MLNRITVQLPVEGLLFWKLSGREALSEPFMFTLTLLGTDARADRSALLGQPVTVTIPTQALMTPRYLNGKVTRVAVSAVELSGTRYAAYELTVEPDLWPMQRDRNLRIFQGQTVPQIVKTLLGESRVNMEERLSGSYRVWEYCVQYQESSLDFISRLLELEGIAYHFRHEQDRHTLVLTDAPGQYEPFPGYETIPYHVTPSGGSTDEEGISQWALEDSVTPGIYSLDDYDDDEQRVREIRFEGNAEFRRVEYRYDPLGRRTHKILWRYGEKDPETIRFDWQGLQLAGEQSDREPDHYVQYVYTEGSYEPLARVDSVFDDCEIYWYHTELNGLPERVTDADGQTVWRGQFSTWGETERELSVPQWQVPQNLRFQGQYLDRESGLHYNLFRYYDPVAGRYTQMDPIGLAGGINTYSYVGDPLTIIDPLGLAPWEKGGFEDWFNNASVNDVIQNKTAVESALRSPGGMHEFFPVSLAPKAKTLGFTAEELKEMTVPTKDITFVDVTDKKGKPVPDGAHHHSRAGRHFHNKLIADLKKAETKNEALAIIERHHNKHMRLGGCLT
ncbi:type VI secretion system tip protein TssI/VgrG [Cronobacter sakazakii]|uniref:type VI secretion system tip protein TssI/VgrG n=1 Tax=Cronobacter sakazakii TaxID=28141 RepID=UPI0004A8C35E|nr:type VI secretion system tip protein TssI/VgrG [Cronobacter sakazakii]KDP98526.1 hypothetical protein ER21_08260 [Cronobacter sakazakii]MDK1283038.1 type VI secretion system tip protein TssI/VgrG [Cronobacter sakazakii]